MIVPLALLFCGISGLYLTTVSYFKKYWHVHINGYRISPWVCSVVFMFWILGMAVCIGVLRLIPAVAHKLLASA